MTNSYELLKSSEPFFPELGPSVSFCDVFDLVESISSQGRCLLVTCSHPRIHLSSEATDNMNLPLPLRLGGSLSTISPRPRAIPSFPAHCFLFLPCTSRATLLLDALQELQHRPDCIISMGPSPVFYRDQLKEVQQILGVLRQ